MRMEYIRPLDGKQAYQFQQAYQVAHRSNPPGHGDDSDWYAGPLDIANVFASRAHANDMPPFHLEVL